MNSEVNSDIVRAEDQLVAIVTEYCIIQRNPNLAPFKVHDAQPWKGWWGSPSSYKSGVYVIYSDKHEPIYIGKASLKATMGSRLAAHERSQDLRWTDAAFVRMIEVVVAFEAPSLEEFLLSKFATRINMHGRCEPQL